jgi:hypothetical protein
MKPSIGRIVHYHGEPGDCAVHGIQAAVITYVHSDTCVNLAVFDHNGESRGETSVCLGGPDQPFTWSWPPKV